MSDGARLCGNCFFEVSNEDAKHCPHCGYSLGPGELPDALPVGSILNGHYIVGRALGQGGFGITYKALDHTTGDIVAVKEYYPDALCHRGGETASITVTASSRDLGDDFYYGREKFLREAETLAGLGDVPGIAHVHEYFEENGTAYFSMDYVEGTDLKDYLRQHGGRMRWQELRGIVYPVMEALDTVHKRGVIHRDISPDNIYVKDTGEAVLLDFGAARASLGERSQSLSVILKHGYAPKEQYYSRGKQGPFTDVYAMGATIYRCLTGMEPPESLERSEALGEGASDPLRPLHEYVPVASGIESAVLKAMSVDAKDRYQTMGEFERALRGADTSDAIATPVGGGGTTQSVETNVSDRSGATSGDDAKKKGPNLSRRQLLGIAGGIGAAAIVAIAATTCGRGGDDNIGDDNSDSGDTDQDGTTSNDNTTASQASGLSLDSAYAVLYADGELVFQEGQDTEDGREVLHAAAVDITDPWWIGKVDSISITAIDSDGTEHEGDWCDQVKKVSSATPIALPDMTGVGVMAALSTTADFGLFNACVNLTDISGLSSWDVSSAKTLHHMFNLCTSLTDISPLESWDLSSVTSIEHMFADCRALADISPVSGWDISSVQDLSALFQNCAELEDLTPISGWDISSVRSMEVTFNDCIRLKDLSPISGWDVSKVENIHGLFAVLPALTDLSPISSWDLSSVTTMSGLFYSCEALSDLSAISGWNTSAVTDMSQLFQECSALRDLTPIAGWDTSKVTTFNIAFSGCKSLNDLGPIAGWDVSSVKEMGSMFSSCAIRDVEALKEWKTSSLTDLYNCFNYCTALSNVSGLSSWDVSYVTNISGLFGGCSALSDISGLSSWDVSLVTNMNYLFYHNTSLNDVSPIEGWNVSASATTDHMFDDCPATPPSWYKG